MQVASVLRMRRCYACVDNVSGTPGSITSPVPLKLEGLAPLETP